MLSKTSAYIKSYGHKTKWIYFSIEDDKLFKKYNTIFGMKFTIVYNKRFDSEPIYNAKILKTKISSYGDEDFHDILNQ